jgi:hypothetical protein
METDRKTIQISATISCAVLYAVGSYITSYVVSPWGVGQFRPAVVIPSLFAVIFGPWPAGIGAAIGTLIADSANLGGFHVGSLIAAVPGNFLGFYLMGWYVKRKFTWSRFIIASLATLVFANFLVAVLYVGVYLNLFMGQLPQLSLGGLTVFIFGLTVWWFVTMLPFVILVTPPLIRGVTKAFPYLVSDDVNEATLIGGIPEKELVMSLLVPGLLMMGLGVSVSFTGLGVQIVGFFGEQAGGLIELMSYLSGLVLAFLGFLFYLRIRTPS